MFLPPLSMCIDLTTLAYSRMRRLFSNKRVYRLYNSSGKPDGSNHTVSVFIPIFNEAEKIRSTVECVIRQTYPLKNIFLLDDLSTDASRNICHELEQRYKIVNHVRRKRKLGKAGNINALVAEKFEEFGDFILVVDGDVRLDINCIEELIKNSDNSDVVTGFGYTTEPTAYVPRILFEGMSWINDVFSFRKRAQVLRQGVFVICGALSLYKAEVLRKIPIPERTVTEDTDYTWLLQEQGYRIKYNKEAKAAGRNPNSLKGFWKRHERWFSGTFQCLFVHGFRSLKKSKSLLYSTILPGCLEVIPYSVTITFLPVLALLWPNLAKGILIADFVLSFPFLFCHRKGFWHAVNHLPDIYAYKFFGSYVCLYSGIKTSMEKILGKTNKWNNNWENSSKVDIRPQPFTKKLMRKHLDDCLYLEKEWVSLTEKAWTKDNFMLNKRKKWKISSCVILHGKLVGYAILSQISKEDAYLHKILVNSDYQRLGIGELLLEESRKKCRKFKIKKIRFKVRVENAPANALYNKNKVVYYDKEMSNDGVERHLCELSL